MIISGCDIWNFPYLEHHGVKGMKWGVRKARDAIGKAKHKAGQALYKRGKKLNRGVYWENGRLKVYAPNASPAAGVLGGFSTMYTAKIVGNTAKSLYDLERQNGLSRPSIYTVGLAAASVVLDVYGAYKISSTAGDAIAYDFYKNNKKNPIYNPKYREKK